jgi:hypothetical protein
MAASSRRNANWSRDETILLLDLYLRHPDAEARHPEVVALSDLLRNRARSDELFKTENFRNPVGIAMKLRNLAQQDPSFQRSGKAGLGHGNRLNAEVWALLANDPLALAEEVKRIRMGMTVSGDGPEAANPSRGPVPTFGSFEANRCDGPTELYILLLEGTEQWLAGQRPSLVGASFLKVGFSNDIERRLEELNVGLPMVLGLRWRRYWSMQLPSASDAYVIEQAVLRKVGELGGVDKLVDARLGG